MPAKFSCRAYFIQRLLVVLCLVVLTACSATHTVHSWVNPRIPPIHKVVVFGVSKEEGSRRLFEDTMSQALVAGGVAAVPSYAVLRNGAEFMKSGELSQDERERAVQASGADAVLITRLVRLAHRLDSVPVPAPAPMWGGVWGWPGPYGAYGAYWPGYYYDSYRVIEREFAFIETNLMHAQSGELLLSIMTRTDDPSYTTGQVQGLVATLSRELGRAGVLRRES